MIAVGNKDRAALHQFADAAWTQRKLVTEKAPGDWFLQGAFGHVQAVPEAGTFYLYTFRPRQWLPIKRAMNWAVVTQDGDTEGILRMDRLPRGTLEGKIIRFAIGLRMKRRIKSAKVLRTIASNRMTSSRGRRVMKGRKVKKGRHSRGKAALRRSRHK
jgi:hypothetical protein